MSAAGGAAAAAVAAAIAAEMAREEEEMTPYGAADLAEGWEFKIVRASTARFRDPAKLRAVLEEEAQGGWILVEKFDDCRIRLKRPASTKTIQDELADGYDPYRTTVGASQGAIVMISLGGILLAVFGLMMVLFLIRHSR